jgi:hypothetical protein
MKGVCIFSEVGTQVLYDGEFDELPAAGQMLGWCKSSTLHCKLLVQPCQKQFQILQIKISTTFKIQLKCLFLFFS